MTSFTRYPLPVFSGIIADATYVPSLRMEHSVPAGKLVPIGAMRFAFSRVNKFLASNRGPLGAGFPLRVENVFKIKTSARPPLDGLRGYGGLSAQFGKLIRSALNSYGHIVPAVCLLLFARSPSTISRFVMSVHINAVYGKSFTGFSHILNEIRKRLPALTNFNSSAAIISPTRDFRIFTAPAAHSNPRDVTFWDHFKRHVSSKTEMSGGMHYATF